MAKVSKGTRQKAIISASKSAYESLGLFADTLVKNTNYMVEDTDEMVIVTDRLVELFQKAFEIENVEKPPTPQEQLKETTERIKKRSFDIATLGLVIPFLINPQAREYLYSFVKGLVGEDAFEKVKFGVTGVLSVLAGVFTVKVIRQVGDSITAMKQLAKVTSVLFGITEAATESTLDKEAELDREKKKVEEENKRKQAEDKKLKDAATKGRDDIKASKQEYKKAGTIGKIRFLATKFGPKVLGAVIKSIPFVGAAATIGLLVADIAGFFSDAEEEKEEPKPQAKPSAAASAPASGQSVSNLPKDKPPAAAAAEAKPSAAASKPPAAAAPVKSSAPSGGAAPEERKPVTDQDLEKLIRQKNAEMEAEAVKNEEQNKALEAAKPAAVPTAKPAPAATEVDTFNKTPGGKKLPEGVTRDRNSGAYVIGENMFMAGTDEAFYAQLKSFKTGEKVEYVDEDRNAGKVKVAFDPKNGKEIVGPASGAEITKSSEEVGAKKKQAKTSTVVVNNIDNSVMVKTSPPPPARGGAPASYSTSAGM